jgi:hypothetical protein
MTTTQDRAKQGMKNMLTAFAKSEHHRDALATALQRFSFKTLDDVTDEKLFDVCEAARSEAGMTTGFMFANARADAGLNADAAKPEMTSEKIDAMARAYYADADAKAS